MFKNKRFPTIEEARVAANITANELECTVPIYMGYSDPPGYHLWHGNELVEWAKPTIENDDGY